MGRAEVVFVVDSCDATHGGASGAKFAAMWLPGTNACDINVL